MKTALHFLLLLALGCAGAPVDSSFRSCGEVEYRGSVIVSDLTETREVVFRGTVKIVGLYGHMPWSSFLALGNVAPCRYTRWVGILVQDVLKGPRDRLPFHVRESGRPAGLRVPPKKGLFLLDKGDVVLVGYDCPWWSMGAPRHVVIGPVPPAERTGEP